MNPFSSPKRKSPKRGTNPFESPPKSAVKIVENMLRRKHAAKLIQKKWRETQKRKVTQPLRNFERSVQNKMSYVGKAGSELASSLSHMLQLPSFAPVNRSVNNSAILNIISKLELSNNTLNARRKAQRILGHWFLTRNNQSKNLIDELTAKWYNMKLQKNKKKVSKERMNALKARLARVLNWRSYVPKPRPKRVVNISGGAFGGPNNGFASKVPVGGAGFGGYHREFVHRGNPLLVNKPRSPLRMRGAFN
jgi:hypothetical protein